eukprot:1160660-Pelagomonas_calceolata.AAC.5
MKPAPWPTPGRGTCDTLACTLSQHPGLHPGCGTRSTLACTLVVGNVLPRPAPNCGNGSTLACTIFFFQSNDAFALACTWLWPIPALKKRKDNAHQVQLHALRRGSLTSELARASPDQLSRSPMRPGFQHLQHMFSVTLPGLVISTHPGFQHLQHMFSVTLPGLIIFNASRLPTSPTYAFSDSPGSHYLQRIPAFNISDTCFQ